MTPEAWVRARLAEKRPLPKTEAELDARRVELRADAQTACGAEAESALHLLWLVCNGVMTEAELPE